MFENISMSGNNRDFSKDETVKLFNAFAENSELRNYVINDGCYERAHKICQKIEEMGKNAYFVLTKKDCSGAYSAKFLAKKKNKYVRFSHNWSSHIAAVVMVNNDKTGKKEALVLDTMLLDGPETLDNWNKHIIDNSKDCNAGLDCVRYDGWDKSWLEEKCKNGTPLIDIENKYSDCNIIKKKSNWLNNYKEESAQKIKMLRTVSARNYVPMQKNKTVDLSKSYMKNQAMR